MFKVFALALVCVLGISAPAFSGTIEVTDAAAAMEADGTTADVFMTITNNGMAIDRLYAAKSKVTKDVFMSAIGATEALELEAKGLENMEALLFEIPPDEPLVFHEEGAHIELRDLKEPLKEGDSFMITLFFETTGPVKVKVEVGED